MPQRNGYENFRLSAHDVKTREQMFAWCIKCDRMKWDTCCPYFFIIPPRACKSHTCGARCGQFVTWSSFRIRRGVHEFYMKRSWRLVEREWCVRFAKLQVATVNLHRPLLTAYSFRYFSKHSSQSLVDAWPVYLCT